MHCWYVAAVYEEAVTRFEGSGLSFRIFIPYISKDTGVFFGYYLIGELAPLSVPGYRLQESSSPMLNVASRLRSPNLVGASAVSLAYIGCPCSHLNRLRIQILQAGRFISRWSASVHCKYCTLAEQQSRNSLLLLS